VKIMVIGNIGFDLMVPYFRQNRIETVLVSIAEGDFHSDLADKTYFFHDRTDWQPLVEVALREKVDAVISISGPDQVNWRDGCLKEALEKDHAIPVLANPLKSVSIAIDKVRTKAWLQSHGFPTTEGHTATTRAEAKELADRFGYPLVLKLPDHSGGLGFRVVASERQFNRAIASRLPVLIEKFASGPEFSVEVLNYDGRALPLLPVYKGSTNPEGLHPMERVKLAPAPLDPADVAHLRQLAKRIVCRLDLQPTADVDFVWTDSGPKVLEINPRFGGVTALSMAASGVTVYWALIDMVLGKWDPANYPFRRAFAADLPIKPDIAQETVARLLNIDGIFRVKLQKLKKTAGRVALRAEDPHELLRIARQAAHLCDCGSSAYSELEQLIRAN
jgi:carbamoylphosphate synthase large subunit